MASRPPLGIIADLSDRKRGEALAWPPAWAPSGPLARWVPLGRGRVAGPVLAEWKLKTDGDGLLFTPANIARGGRPELGTDPTFIRPHTLHRHLDTALTKCKLLRLSWYQCTRHTFASLFDLGGGSIELLSKVMGHASVTTTEHYSHLRPDLFSEKAFEAVSVDLSKPAGNVLSLSPSCPNEYTMRTTQADTAAESSLSQRPVYVSRE